MVLTGGVLRMVWTSGGTFARLHSALMKLLHKCQHLSLQAKASTSDLVNGIHIHWRLHLYRERKNCCQHGPKSSSALSVVQATEEQTKMVLVALVLITIMGRAWEYDVRMLPKK
ncbi:uncharacterized protein [Physcomitrium patens]|uniref:uncharacterized protein n=1 Tax=Physcomitrium patens TaxID=3218 RepID=UPI000D155950|nr:uncharacterized protein LOC112280506 [Physcomitrium patens]|eukprot:XP_024371827.1 uncharacterized protein LOC112280506 [Physcomitrella patens]